MNSHVIKQGSQEIGIIHYNGQTFVSGGASTHGPHIVAYTKGNDRKRQLDALTGWQGNVILQTRCEILEMYWSESWGKTFVVLFRLPHGRFIVGYALGLDGCLFRGELMPHGTTEEDARHDAVEISRQFMERDTEDEQEQTESD